jgi:hypothetical protein
VSGFAGSGQNYTAVRAAANLGFAFSSSLATKVWFSIITAGEWLTVTRSVAASPLHRTRTSCPPSPLRRRKRIEPETPMLHRRRRRMLSGVAAACCGADSPSWTRFRL